MAAVCNSTWPANSDGSVRQRKNGRAAIQGEYVSTSLPCLSALSSIAEHGSDATFSSRYHSAKIAHGLSLYWSICNFGRHLADLYSAGSHPYPLEMLNTTVFLRKIGLWMPMKTLRNLLQSVKRLPRIAKEVPYKERSTVQLFEEMATKPVLGSFSYSLLQLTYITVMPCLMVPRYIQPKFVKQQKIYGI